MNLSKVLGFRRTRIRNRIFTLGVIITGMLSIAFAIITFYGQNAGNFVISVDSIALNRGIILAENINFTNPSPRLMTEPISEARDMTYSWLKIEEVEATNGNYTDIDYDYVAYTFYLMNQGSESVDISYHIRITDIYNDLDSAIRVLVIEDGEETIYQKPDELDENGNPPYYPENVPDSVDFLSETIVMRKLFTNFKPDQVKKFSIIIWLEGYDPDTVDEILGGMIRLQMNFSINGLES
ncbi:MAG: hypothetical protein CVV58_03965 [Tenericutes bacterium HGW-Tenericutes-3]|nr:MAG: hypothetical protein CVV58_03965 [Tenericutes bacterium HGW-Tenericutes-3]